MQNAIRVLYGRFLDFEDDKGKKLKGTQVHYQMLGGETEPDSFGIPPAKAFLDGVNLLKDGALKAGAGDYNAVFSVKASAGKYEVKLVSIGDRIAK